MCNRFRTIYLSGKLCTPGGKSIQVKYDQKSYSIKIILQEHYRHVIIEWTIFFTITVSLLNLLNFFLVQQGQVCFVIDPFVYERGWIVYIHICWKYLYCILIFFVFHSIFSILQIGFKYCVADTLADFTDQYILKC